MHGNHITARTGLLNDVDADYYVSHSYQAPNNVEEFDAPRRDMTMPPRGLFDDV